MRLLVLQAYLRLFQFDLDLARHDFPALHERVRRCQLSSRRAPPDAIARICTAIDTACVCYWKQVLCLERSAATACLMRRYGVPAQLVIGAQRMPFRAHAWVEVDGQVVNDKAYTPELYSVLERC